MTLWRPPQIPYLSDFILGHWPDGDEDAMRRAAKHWSAMADALGALQDPADQAMAEALAAIDGQANDALTSYWQEISGGDGSDIAQLKKNCESFAEQLEHGATDIEHAKLVIYITAVSLLASLAWALIPGVGQAAEAGAIVAAKAAVTKATQQLMSKLVAKGAVFLGERVAGVAVKVGVGAVVGTAFGAGTDAAAQGIELAEGHREDGFDWSSTGTAAAAGAVGGAVAAPVSHFVGDKIGDRVTSAVARDTDVPGVAAKWAGRSVADIPSDLAANAAGQVATGQPLTVDSLLEGAGAGVATHPGRHGPASSDVDTTTQSAEGNTSQSTNAAEPPAATGPPMPSDTTPVQSVAAPPPETQNPGAGATPASTTPSSVAPPADSAGPAATVAAGHHETAVAQNDSAGQGQASETRNPAPEQRQASAAPGASDSGSPASSAPGSSLTDRAAAPPSSAAASASPADRPTPAGRTADAGPQPPNSAGVQGNRSPDVARSPGVETPDRRTPDATPATGAARPEAAAARSATPADVPARTDASPRPRGDSSLHQGPPVVVDQPRRDGNVRRDNGENGGRRPSDRARGDDSGPVRGLPEDSRNRDRAEVPVRERHDEPGPRAGDREGRPDRRSDGREDRPAAHDGRRTHPGEEGNQPSVAGRGRYSGLSGSDQSSGARGDRLVGDDHADRERTRDADAAAQSPTSPADRMHHPGEVTGSDAPAVVPDAHTGGAIRPRDDFAAFEWAEDAYDRFRGDDRDIDDIARVLAQYPRADGSNFSRDDIRRIKDHLFREEHPIRDYDGDVVHRRYDADPGIAEAWIRLRSDRPDPADLVLLEHELTEANYYRDHPGSLYQDAHAHANIDHNWSEVAAGRSGERYDTLWGPDNGTTDLLQPNREQPGRGDVPVRGDQGPPGPHPDDRQGEQRPPYGPTGGRDFPVGRRPDPDAGQTREAVAGERSHRFLTEDAAPPYSAPPPRDEFSGTAPTGEPDPSLDPGTFDAPGASDPAPRERLPVEDKDYFANPEFRDPDAGAEYARQHPGYLSEAADIRSRQREDWPELFNLSDAEIAAIRHNQFDVLNGPVIDATRNGNRALLEQYDAAIRALVSGLNKLPDLQRPVHRSVRFYNDAELHDFLADYDVGGVRVDPGFVSSDKEASTGNIQMGTKVEFVIESRHGKDISWASGQQDEVVFPPGHSFEITSRIYEDGKYVIHLFDLGRDPDGTDTGTGGRDRSDASGADAATSSPRSGSGGTPRAPDGGVEGARSEGPPRSDRGTREELGTLAQVGDGTNQAQAGGERRVDPDGLSPPPQTPDRLSAQSPDSDPPRYRSSEDPRVTTRHDASLDSVHHQGLAQTHQQHPGPLNQSPGSRRVESQPPVPDHRAPVSNPPVHDHRVSVSDSPNRPSVQAHPVEQARPVQSPPGPESLHSNSPTPQHPTPHQAPAPHIGSSLNLGPPNPSQQGTHAAVQPRQPVPPQHSAPPAPVPDPRNPNSVGRQDDARAQQSTTEGSPRRSTPEDRWGTQGNHPAPRADNGGHGPHRSDPQAPPAQRQPSREEVRANESRQMRDYLRGQMPEGGTVTQVRTRGSAPAYDVRRYPNAPGGPITVVTVRVNVTADPHIHPQAVQQLIHNAHYGTDSTFNQGQRLLSGDRVLVDLVPATDPATANIHMHVSESPGAWHPRTPPDLFARQLGRHLGLPEQPGSTAPHIDATGARQLSNDIARANTPCTRPDVTTGRVQGAGNLRSVEHASYQHNVEDAVRRGDRFVVGADPHVYAQHINDGGPSRPGRSNDCNEVTLSVLSTHLGRPVVAAPRFPDRLADGSLDTRTGERLGLRRAEEWIGGAWQNYGHGGASIPDQFQALHNWVGQLGPGAAAYVHNAWHATDEFGRPQYNADGSPRIGGSHATAIVYPIGARGPMWVDAQARPPIISEHPPAHLVNRSAGLRFMTVDPNGVSRSGATAGQRGTGAGVPEHRVPESGVRHGDPVRTRVGMSSATDSGGGGTRSGSRPDQLRGESTDRRRDRAPESAPDDGGRNVRPGDSDRRTRAGSPDLPTTESPRSATAARGIDNGPVLGRDRVPERSLDQGVRADDRHGDSRLRADGLERGERDVVGRVETGPRRDMASGGDVRGVGQGPDTTPATRTHENDRHAVDPSSSAPEALENGRRDQPAAETPPDNTDHSEPPTRSREPVPKLKDLFPPDGAPLDEERVLAQLQQAINGEYGGLRVVVERVSGDSGGLYPEMTIYDADGKQVGRATRSYFYREGNILANHSVFSLHKSVQGQGFAGEWNTAMFEWYRESGVTEVVLRANIDVGSYAWARQGFEFSNQQQAVNDILPRLNREIRKLRAVIARESAEQARSPSDERVENLKELAALERKAAGIVKRFRVGDEDFPHPEEIALLGRPEGASSVESRDLSWLGKRVFMEPGVTIMWHAVRWIGKEAS